MKVRHKKESTTTWLNFHSKFQDGADYNQWSPIEDELFGYVSVRNRTNAAREIAKAIASVLRRYGPARKHLVSPCRQYDYCFVVDGTAANGLGTLFPVIAAVPDHAAILLLTRSWVLRDSRFVTLRQKRGALEVIDIDTCVGPGRLDFVQLFRNFLQLRRVAAPKWYALPQLLLRQAFYDAVLRIVIDPLRIRHLIVANERMLLSNLSIQRAKVSGVKATCMQHGLFVDTYLPVLCDQYLVWGTFGKNWLLRHGVNAEIRILGAPRLDHIHSLIDCSPIATSKIGYERAMPSLLFFSQPIGVDYPEDEFLYCWRVVLDFARKHKNDIETRIKLHPSDRLNRYEAALGRTALDYVMVIPASSDPHQEIIKSNYVVSFYSTTLIEAMLLGKPCLQLLREGVNAPNYTIDGGALRVRDQRELGAQIDLLSSSLKFRASVICHQQRFAKEHVHNLGTATRQFFELVT